jgi:hypothetical protein
LAYALGDQADAGVFPVAIELMKSGDDGFLRLEGMLILQAAGTDLSGPVTVDNGMRAKTGLGASRLGPYLNETVSALTEVANQTTRQDLRLQAARMLDVLSPDFRKNDPQKAEDLEREDQTAAFIFRVRTHQAAMSEILEGLKKYPKAAPAVGEILAGGGSATQKADARQALGALGEALSALAPPNEASGGDRAEAIRARGELANAMQEIAPELPKPIFTGADVMAIHKILFDPAQRADPDRRQRVSAARAVAQWPTKGPCDVSPDQVRRLLAAVKDADASTHDALVAKVTEIDPHFSDTATTSAKGH